MNLYLHTFLEKLRNMEQSPRRLTLSCCAGVFVALSPFLGMQTILAFFISYLMHLNTALVILVLYLINNPFTMIPIVIADYTTGALIFNNILHIDLHTISPAWMRSVDAYLTTKLIKLMPHAQFSIENYFVGGCILALGTALIVYPILAYCFARMSPK